MCKKTLKVELLKIYTKENRLFRKGIKWTCKKIIVSIRIKKYYGLLLEKQDEKALLSKSLKWVCEKIKNCSNDSKSIYDKLLGHLRPYAENDIKAARADLIKNSLPELITNSFSAIAIIVSLFLGFLSNYVIDFSVLLMIFGLIAYAMILLFATLRLQKYKFVLQVVNDYLDANYDYILCRSIKIKRRSQLYQRR